MWFRISEPPKSEITYPKSIPLSIYKKIHLEDTHCGFFSLISHGYFKTEIYAIYFHHSPIYDFLKYKIINRFYNKN